MKLKYKHMLVIAFVFSACEGTEKSPQTQAETAAMSKGGASSSASIKPLGGLAATNETVTTSKSETSHSGPNEQQLPKDPSKYSRKPVFAETTPGKKIIKHGFYFPKSTDPTPENVCKVIKELKKAPQKEGTQVAIVIDPHLESSPDKVIASEVTIPSASNKKTATICDALKLLKVPNDKGELEAPLFDPPLPETCDANVFLKGIMGLSMSGGKWWGFSFKKLKENEFDLESTPSQGIGSEPVTDGMLVTATFSKSIEKNIDGQSTFEIVDPARAEESLCNQKK